MTVTFTRANSSVVEIVLQIEGGAMGKVCFPI